jgi:hypothetical protein
MVRRIPSVLSRGTHRFKQLDVERAIRAARKQKGLAVKICPDGAILLVEISTSQEVPGGTGAVGDRPPMVF